MGFQRSITEFPIPGSLVQVEGALGRRTGFVFFGLLQQLLEAFLAELVAAFMRCETLLEGVVPAIGISLELLRSSVQVLNQRLLLRLPMMNYKLRLGIDLQTRSATRAFDFEQLTVPLSHTGIVAQRMAARAGCYSLNCESP